MFQCLVILEAAVEVLHVAPRERVQNRTLEQIVDVPVPHIKEDGLLLVPQERVHNRAAYTRKVFTVKLRHHRDDHGARVSDPRADCRRWWVRDRWGNSRRES